jgi:hypothetical protein
MKKKESFDLLLRNIPIDVYHLLEESAKEHNRSKTQEAIVALTNGLARSKHCILRPRPFRWKKKISSKFIEDAINEGRE